MPRDARAYLADVVESCAAIKVATADMSLAEYQSNRLVRSSVEREFILIGEAMAALARVAPALFESITRARRIVDFRNQLTDIAGGYDIDLHWDANGDPDSSPFGVRSGRIASPATLSALLREQLGLKL